MRTAKISPAATDDDANTTLRFVSSHTACKLFGLPDFGFRAWFRRGLLPPTTAADGPRWDCLDNVACQHDDRSSSPTSHAAMGSRLLTAARISSTARLHSSACALPFCTPPLGTVFFPAGAPRAISARGLRSSSIGKRYTHTRVSHVYAHGSANAEPRRLVVGGGL